MKSLRRLLPLLSLLSLTPALSAGADTPAAPPVITANPVMPIGSPPPPTITFNIDYPGGPLSKFLDAVAGIDRVSLSIVGTESQPDLSTPLPPFQLRNVDVMTVTGVLRTLLEPRGFLLHVVGNPDPNSVVSVLQRIDRPKPVVPPSASEFESFQLWPYLVLKEQSVEDIVGAVRAAWELDPRHEAAALRLKFHPPTSILLVSGPPEALNVARKVLSQLNRTTEKTKPSPRPEDTPAPAKP